jgi:sensor histidine kinase YesM
MKNKPRPVATKKLYWIFQVAGWLAMLFYELVNYIGLGVFSFTSFGWLSVSALVALLLTHIYHLIIRRVNYFSFKAYQQVLYFFAALVGLSVCLFWVSALEEMVFFHSKFPVIFSIQALMYIINWSRYIAVWLLCYHVAKYFTLKNRAEMAVLQTTVELQDTRLNVLRLQLNPHFLFNALNSIRSLIVYDSDLAREATTRLSQLLRHTLNYEKQDFITLRQEMDIVADYLTLEKIRFDERLNYTAHMDKEAGEKPVPASIVLTLVENAIKHGIGNSIKGGTIDIVVTLHAGVLLIEVLNTGQLAQTSNQYSGIGTANIQKRLELYYRQGAKFILENATASSVSAKVYIPLTV